MGPLLSGPGLPDRVPARPSALLPVHPPGMHPPRLLPSSRGMRGGQPRVAGRSRSLATTQTQPRPRAPRISGRRHSSCRRTGVLLGHPRPSLRGARACARCPSRCARLRCCSCRPPAAACAGTRRSAACSLLPCSPASAAAAATGRCRRLCRRLLLLLPRGVRVATAMPSWMRSSRRSGVPVATLPLSPPHRLFRRLRTRTRTRATGCRDATARAAFLPVVSPLKAATQLRLCRCGALRGSLSHRCLRRSSSRSPRRRDPLHSPRPTRLMMMP